MQIITGAAIGIAMLGLAGCGGGPYTLTPAEQDVAKLGAYNYAKEIGGGWEFASCKGQDSEPDGNVTCTLKKGGDVKKLECGYKATGCSEKKASLFSRRRRVG